MAVGLRCGSTTIKYLLFFFNFLFVLCGLAIVILGALALNATAKNGNGLDSALIFMTFVGALIFIVAFFGCCGAVKESHCMLIAFACLLMTIIVLEVVAAVLVFVNAGGLEESVQKVFEEARKGNAELKQFTDAVQKSLNCCGTTGAAFYTENSGSIPGSCCGKGESETCTAANEINAALGRQGCRQLVLDTLKMFGKAVGAVAIAVAVVEVIGVWFALALAGEIKKLSR